MLGHGASAYQGQAVEHITRHTTACIPICVLVWNSISSLQSQMIYSKRDTPLISNILNSVHFSRSFGRCLISFKMKATKYFTIAKFFLFLCLTSICVWPGHGHSNVCIYIFEFTNETIPKEQCRSLCANGTLVWDSHCEREYKDCHGLLIFFGSFKGLV